MTRDDFLNGVYAASTTPLFAGGTGSSKALAGIAIPDSALAREATDLAISTEDPILFNHSMRTFLFAELFAQENHIAHDVELVYVASILHDAGLVPRYSSDSERFEVDGANLARSVMERHGVDKASTDLVWDAIALHPQSGIAKWKAPEVRLVNVGVRTDFGVFLDQLPKDTIRAIMAAAPRTGFVTNFLASCAVIAKKKPQATGKSFMTDIGYRMVPGFQLPNFCDEVKEDPFAALGI